MGDHLRLMVYRIGRKVSFEWFGRGATGAERCKIGELYSMRRVRMFNDGGFGLDLLHEIDR
jgi:hypothetical protein